MSVACSSRRSSIDVFIRLRPMRAELREVKAAWVTSATTLQEKSNPDALFTFDHVYNTDTTTHDIYNRSVRDGIVANVAKGYNGTVIAYGQTGSGKSYTMLGPYSDKYNGGDGSFDGIVALAVRDLFVNLEKEERGNLLLRTSVYVTIIEIYNEQLGDLLLSPGAVTAPLFIRENEHGVYVHNATKRKVKNARECIQLIYTHVSSRVSAFTSMNEMSSRSHCVICIHVEKSFLSEEATSEYLSCSEETDEDKEDGRNDCGAGMRRKIVATLNLVDLAGSERVAKSGSAGVRKVEGGYINKSLATLTTVISRLSEVIGSSGSNLGGTSMFVPYRDSRLTHLLKTAVGGNSLTVFFCCITPALQHVNESRSTLQFAARVKTIKNQVLMNEISNPKLKLREVEAKLQRCKRMLLAMTIYLWSKNVRIKNLEAKLVDSAGFCATDKGRKEDLKTVRTTRSEQQQQQQQRRFVDIAGEPTRRNKVLMDELTDLQGAMRRHCDFAEGACVGFGAAVGGLADDEEKRRLRENVRQLEQKLKQAVDEKIAIEKSMDELDGLCKELEEENAAYVSENKKLDDTCKELQLLVDDTKKRRESGGETKNEVDALKQPPFKKISDLPEKNRGDEYLHQLTKLHIEHQELQYAHHQLQEKYEREMGEERAKLDEMQTNIEELEDEVADLRDANKLQNSYLWRLLAVASVVSSGKAIVPGNTTTAAVNGAQVDAAVKTLTSFVMTSLEKPANSAQSAGGGHDTTLKKPKQQKDMEGETGGLAEIMDGARGQTKDSGDEAALLKRIDELQRELVVKDAQRDVIVDSKLKRMQNLVLRLHTTNTELVKELEVSCAQCDKLFHMIEKYPKLAQQLSNLGFFPVSFNAAVERATRASVPSRPYGHN